MKNKSTEVPKSALRIPSWSGMNLVAIRRDSREFLFEPIAVSRISTSFTWEKSI